MATRHLVLSRFLLRGEMVPVLYCFLSLWTFIIVNDERRLIQQEPESYLANMDYWEADFKPQTLEISLSADV